MKKRLISIILIVVFSMLFVGCGFGIYTCTKCDKTMMKAYYTTSMNIDHVMCEECARKYWMPLPIENYRVK